MAKFRFKRITETGKTALILVKKNAFELAWTPVYIPVQPVIGMKEDEEGELPDGYKIIPMVDPSTGEVYTAKDGSPLHSLRWE